METNLNNNSIERELLNKLIEGEAWKKLSSDNKLVWSEQLIEKYLNYWNWEELSKNNNIGWTIDMLEKFKKKISWKHLSEEIFSHRSRIRFNIELVEKFENMWDWSELSRRSDYLSFKDIEHFAHRWHWSELIDNRNLKWNNAMFEHFKNFISIGNFSSFQRTELWDNLVEVELNKLNNKISNEIVK